MRRCLHSTVSRSLSTREQLGWQLWGRVYLNSDICCQGYREEDIVWLLGNRNSTPETYSSRQRAQICLPLLGAKVSSMQHTLLQGLLLDGSSWKRGVLRASLNLALKGWFVTGIPDFFPSQWVFTDLTDSLGLLLCSWSLWICNY